jgi:predicted GNAT family acetyltransferase
VLDSEKGTGMRSVMNDPLRNLSVVENDEMRRYDLLVSGMTAGTLDFRVLGTGRVLGHTEVKAEQRGRGLGTTLIKAVLDDLITSEALITNYSSAIERFLQRYPEYLMVLDPSHPPTHPPRVQGVRETPGSPFCRTAATGAGTALQAR